MDRSVKGGKCFTTIPKTHLHLTQASSNQKLRYFRIGNSSDSADTDSNFQYIYQFESFGSATNMLLPPTTAANLTAADFARLNTHDDAEFYAEPRFVKHNSDTFLRKLTELYAQILTQSHKILDICSSFESFLPDSVLEAAHEVVGTGMNEKELAANRQLSSYFVHDLNNNPQLSQLKDVDFDAVLCCSGVQYLTQPFEVFQEVGRVLKPGGCIIISYSSNCFPDKAISGWLSRDKFEKQQLVMEYLMHAGFQNIRVVEWKEADFIALVAIRVAQGQGALSEIQILQNTTVSQTTIERWAAAYEQASEDAHALGIPKSAIPTLPLNASVAEIKQAHEYLDAMTASFLSAGL